MPHSPCAGNLADAIDSKHLNSLYFWSTQMVATMAATR